MLCQAAQKVARDPHVKGAMTVTEEIHVERLHGSVGPGEGKYRDRHSPGGNHFSASGHLDSSLRSE